MTVSQIPFLPFAVPDLGEEEIAEVVDTLRSGWITTGPKVHRFEADFGGFLGGGVQCIAVNSATAGLHLALEAAGIGPGDKVVVPTHTFTATAEVVRYLGADPVFVDIDLDTYCIDPDAVRAAITPDTRMLMPVHFGGLSCDMERLVGLAREKNLAVVEDAAHAFPTVHLGRMVGTLDTDCAVFSFYANKTLATGEGGMLVTRRADIAKRARIMRLHGIDRDAFDRYVAKKPSWYYEVIEPGFKYNMTDIAAAIGLQQLKKARQFQERREYLANRYFEELADLPLVLPPRAPAGSSHAWHLFVVRLRDDLNMNRDDVIGSLYSAGIGCSVHYIPLHMQPYWRDRYNLRAADFPNSTYLFQRGFTLPLYTRMSDADLERVVRCLRSILT